jgi:hypothetical protein
VFTASRPRWLSPISLRLPSWTSWLPTAGLVTELNSVGRVIQPRSEANRKHRSSVDVGGVVSRAPLQWNCPPRVGSRGNTASYSSPIVASRHRGLDMFLLCVCADKCLLGHNLVTAPYTSFLGGGSLYRVFHDFMA